jgi:hypothetical protein
LAFWNIAGNVAPATVAAFAHESDADILILAENKIPNDRLVLALNSGVDRHYFSDPLPPGRLTIFFPEPPPLGPPTAGVQVECY